MDRLRRRHAQLLVASALLGAVVGAALGLVTETAQIPRAVAASPLRDGASGVRVGPPSSRPPAAWPAASQPQAASGSSAGWSAKDGKGIRKGPGQRGKAKPGKGNGEPGKGGHKPGKGNHKQPAATDTVLGNLLCQIAGLLDRGASLSAVADNLNQVLKRL